MYVCIFRRIKERKSVKDSNEYGDIKREWGGALKYISNSERQS